MPETLDITDFRSQTRTWLEANCPPEMRTPMASDDDICWGGRNAKFTSDAQRLWLERMGERGWTAPTWPREMLATTTYEDLGDGTTRLSVTWVPLNATEVEEATFDGARAGMQGGWDHQFGQIEGYLAGL
jgi:alkylation response protein AidB-like acyl-CoA dehydrogenase